MMEAIGIDLGTTYSCVAIYVAENGTASILPDAEGNRCIPSVVSFAGGNVDVGYGLLCSRGEIVENGV